MHFYFLRIVFFSNLLTRKRGKLYPDRPFLEIKKWSFPLQMIVVYPAFYNLTYFQNITLLIDENNRLKHLVT